LPEGAADATKHVAVFTIYKYCSYIYIYVVHVLVWMINYVRLSEIITNLNFPRETALEVTVVLLERFRRESVRLR